MSKSLKVSVTTWNLDSLVKTPMEEERKLIEEKNYEFINKWRNREDYLKEPLILAQALDEYEELERHFGTEGNQGYYFWLKSHLDENDPEIKAQYNKIRDFGNKIRNDINFFELNIAKIPSVLQKEFLEHPLLQKYKHYLERLFAWSPYLLSEKEEKILTLKGAASHSNWVKMTAGFLSKEEREVLDEDGTTQKKNYAEITSLMSNSNKNVRDRAAEAFNEIISKHIDVAEAEMNSILANKKTDDEIRNMSRPDLARHISDDIESEVVDAVVESVSRRYDISKRYYQLKAQLMKVPKLAYHERNVEYGELDKKYYFQEGVDLVYKVFTQLDPEFGDIFERFITNGQIDVYPKKGKYTGAFCIGNLISQPTYLLLNFDEKLTDVITLSHELGHGINDELIKAKQHALDFGTPISTAEVASTFMEDFVLQEVMSQADEELKLSLLVSKLNDDISSIFRQVACYQFEQDIHSQYRLKGYLSSVDIGRIFQKHMENYMGEAVEQSTGSENWWVYWSHIRSFFYVYSYASGLLISKSLQNSVKNDHSFIHHVKEFLSAGTSDTPKNIFKKVNVDITDKLFWDKGIDEIEKLLNETEELAKKLHKI